MKHLLTLMAVLCLTSTVIAQESQNSSPIIFIYDASGSMWGQIDGKTKMKIASDVLSESVNNLPADQSVGLVAYGHRQKGDCEDVEFLIGAENKDKSSVRNALGSIKPLGKTPLAYSAVKVIDFLRSHKMKATIILITDGIESCGGNICDVIKKAKEEGIDFRLHIIGFGLTAGETDQLRCATEAGDGQYYDAADAGGLGEVLTEATRSTVDDPEGNFSVYAVKNGQPVDAYIEAFLPASETSVDAIRTYADTGKLYLSPGKYDILARPLENSDVDPVKIKSVEQNTDENGHLTISFDGGKIKVMTTNNGEGWDAVISIYQEGASRTAAGGRTYGKSVEYEVSPGRYQIEYKAMKIRGSTNKHKISNVTVNAGETTEHNHNFDSGIAVIGAKSGTSLVDAVVSITDAKTGKNVDGSRTYDSEPYNPKSFILSPGTYNVELKALKEHKGKIEKFTMEIRTGETFKRMVEF